MLLSSVAAFSQAASPYVSVLGVVEKVDMAGKVLTVKPPTADATTVKFDERARFLKMAAGETDTKKATPAAATDVAVGDRVIARVLDGRPDGQASRHGLRGKASRSRRAATKTQDEWKTSTSGLVKSIDGRAVTITARVPGSPAPKDVAVQISPKVDVTRYNPENGKYEASTMAAIKVGDQLRVLGEKNGDSTEIKASDVGVGTFKTMGVLVKTIDTAAKQISGTDTGTKLPVTIRLRADTSLKKFNDMSAMMVARQINPTYQQAGGRGNRGGGAPAADGAGATAGGGRGMGGGRGGGRGMDIGKIIDQQPSIELADIKPGDALIVNIALGIDAGRSRTRSGWSPVLNRILRAAPNNGPDPLGGGWNMGGGGGEP